MSADPQEAVLVVVTSVTSDMPIDSKQVPGLYQLSGIPENPAGCNRPSRKLVRSFSYSLNPGAVFKINNFVTKKCRKGPGASLSFSVRTRLGCEEHRKE